jgi:hypothetical protein
MFSVSARSFFAAMAETLRELARRGIDELDVHAISIEN